MDPSSDPALHFQHHRQAQRHQRLGSPLPSGGTATASSSQPQGPTSPSASNAASATNPFVRSHHEDSSAQPPPRMLHCQNATGSAEPGSTSLSRTESSSSLSQGEEIYVAVKCPSLDKDSVVVKVKASDTVRALKHTIERTWPGAPRADGMRCIRSGRILADGEILGQLSQNLEGSEPLSLHLVIRPDAWSDPQNRPTPSRRSSYLRQQQQQQQQQHQSFLRSALAAQLPTRQNPEDDVPPPLSTLSNQSRSGWKPQFEPYYSDATTRQSAPSASSVLVSQSDFDASTSSAAMAKHSTGRAAIEPYAVLEETLRVTAPENWPTLIEALEAACDEYVLMYEAIYNDALAAQKSGPRPASPFTPPASQSGLLTSIETTLLGWDPIQRPNEARASASLTQSDTEFLYHQVSHRGLPYLLRIAATPLDVQRSEALHILLQRITTLRTMIDKLENMIVLGRLLHDGPFTRAATTSNPAIPPPLNGAPIAGRAMALEQGGIVATVTRLVRSAGESMRSITFADATAVIIPMMFVAFKVGILLSVMLHGADKTKTYFVLGVASIYVAFESYRIVQRRMRMRRRTAAAPAPAAGEAPAPDPAQEPNRVPVEQPNPAPAQQAGLGPVEQAAGPTGANVPTAPSHEEAVERQATEEPLRPLPPPRAPPRFRSRTRFTYDWWIDHMAFIGLDAEDAELGLLPAPGSAALTQTGSSMLSRLMTSSWVLPVVLFVFTMMPAVEQRRKRAIEERERVIRKWSRLEQERRERAAELLRQQQEAKETTGGGEQDHGVGGEAERCPGGREQLEMEIKRSEYADRMLRQRRNTEAVDVDEEDRMLMQAVAEGDGEDEDAMEDMNIF